ncbi:MAG TPA: transposase [Candidatus Woesebacteria bacterium]|nr:transposase [Candidatus Woesebacteria bacterium]
MRKYRCPQCTLTTYVIRQRKRGDSIVYLCRECSRYFSVKTIHVDTKGILSDHLDGLSFRKLATKYGISKSQASNICSKELQRLPNNNEFTFQYCNRFSNTLVVDGKYVTVKGYKYGYVLLWGVDYFRHDIPIFTLAPSENYQAWAKYFSYYRIINTVPQLVVCDDNVNIKMAARSRFPSVTIQTCHNHFKENIRRALHVRSDCTYKPFMKRVEAVLGHKRNDRDMNAKLFALYRDFNHDPVCVSVLTNIHRYMPELLAYRGVSQAPLTTNLMESFNSQLESRLFSLNYFNSILHAKLWLNGFILKRRFTKFTSCSNKFKFLNGKSGVQMTKKERVPLPLYF